MKTIRYLAAFLLLLSGILHIIPFIKNSSDPDAVPMLIFGIVYFLIGVFLFLNVRFSEWLGIIFPVFGLGAGFFVIGMENWDAMIIFLLVVDVVVIISCLLLLLNKKKI